MFNDMVYYNKINLIIEENASKGKGMREYMKLEFRWIKKFK